MDYQKVLLQNLDLIDRVVNFIARRHHLSVPDAEEFQSIVRFRLIDRDFAILRKFQGRSNMTTYLTTVIERLYLDFCIARWGKWRPSAAARRLGSVAAHLERLLMRDGLTFEEAVTTLHTNHAVSATREELLSLMARLPSRPNRKPAGEEELQLLASRRGSEDQSFDRVDDEAELERVETALARAVAGLPEQDQLILKLRFQEGASVAQIARAIGEDSKPLYRRLDRIIARLREELGKEAIDQTAFDRIVGNPGLTLGGIFQEDLERPLENAGTRPSKG